MKKRIEWIDIARGITMISVVIGHSLYGYNNGLLSHFIYTFHMPIFFILTGYLYKKKRYVDELRSTSRNLLLPYYFTGLIMVVVYLLATTSDGSRVLSAGFVPTLNDLISALLYGAGVQPLLPFSVTIFACGMIWFLIAMAISLQIFNFTMRKTENLKQRMVLRLLIFSSCAVIAKIVVNYWLLPLSLNAALFALIFMYIGYLMKQSNVLSDLKFWLILASLAMWILVANTQSLNMSSVKTDDTLLAIIGASSGSIVIFKISQILEKTNLIKVPLRIIGQYSIIFFCFHNIDVAFSRIPSFIINSTFTNSIVVKIIIVMIYRLVIPTLAVILIPRTPILKSIFLNRQFPLMKKRERHAKPQN
ncbi:acyltransferase family protein [Lactiplantibacillus argentoratensis]|nr:MULTISPECIES: acyltransferase family protein [Lactiplantibacillus]MBT1143106.1 acyltransferase family protein [Lactiplantibacillus argentoratensis]MBT1145966.1 acyltransferase family protein [Lactiplantibacillus argentoratensis]MBT1148721.1 acyltransferase family protein [Lactiplantibacillus argentoratensis]MBT1152948.1 acyltransferase family protein [Lactiplantibacillus argentoratensis]MCT0195554.1 hypothetical protein [Lactiplantibacillus plantarum]